MRWRSCEEKREELLDAVSVETAEVKPELEGKKRKKEI
jgi:hypothetical protein